MTWVIRKGQDRGRGDYLWEVDTVRDYGMAIGTLGGGSHRWPTYVGMWNGTSRGALRFAKRDQAYRTANHVQGRVVRLRTADASSDRREDGGRDG